MENKFNINQNNLINFSTDSNIIKETKEVDKLCSNLDIIKKDLHNFISKSEKKGFNFKIKINEKKKRIKLFITLTNNSDTNIRNEDIDFLIESSEEYPSQPPMVFCLSCVKIIFINKLILYLVYRYR